MAVADGATALNVLEHTGPFDVVLCSLKLKSTEGLAVIESLSRGGFLKSVIICSLYPADLHSALDRMLSMYGINVLGYVDTPVRSSEIGPMVGRFLESVSVRRTQVSTSLNVQWPTKAEFKQAILEKQFKAFFQPKFNLLTGTVDSLEVLARWESPQHGLLCPAEFLPLLNRFNLMDDLLFAQLEQGLALLCEEGPADMPFNLAFNVQAEQFSNPSLVADICALAKRYNVAMSRLTFEITESGLLEISPSVLESLIRLRMLGTGLSIDDFGVGFSSLERLCQLPFTEIKLDAGFIRNLDTNAANRAIVSSTLALGNALNMTVVVEGVETESQRQSLITLGCVQAQGYLCARPMSASRLLEWLGAPSVCVNHV